MGDVWLFASGLVIPTVMTLAFSYKAFSGEFYYVKILWSCIINFQNFMFSWFLSVNTNRLWAPCSGDQVHQGDKDSSCHKFFLTSPECDIQMHQWNPLVPSACVLYPDSQGRHLSWYFLSLSLFPTCLNEPAPLKLLPYISLCNVRLYIPPQGSEGIKKSISLSYISPRCYSLSVPDLSSKIPSFQYCNYSNNTDHWCRIWPLSFQSCWTENPDQ